MKGSSEEVLAACRAFSGRRRKPGTKMSRGSGIISPEVIAPLAGRGVCSFIANEGKE